MRRSLVGAVLGLAAWMLASAGTASAQAIQLGGSPLQAQVSVGADGTAWVGVWVDAPNVVIRPTARAPMAVSLVVDISGSMAGEKIRNAQLAASSLVESLADGDIVSIYGFSNVVTEIAPPTLVDPNSRGSLMQRVSLLVAGGGTNLYGGMQVGVQRISQAPATHSIRRIFLISDGHANIGPTDPVMLGDLAASATEWGTQVTAIGVGYDYDPNTLNAMVVRSAGRLHHLGTPSQLSAILEQELQRMSSSVALNAFVEITPAPGVVILEGATTGATVVDGKIRFPLGALFSGQRREVLFRARVDTSRLGARPLATARLAYEAPDRRGGAQAQTAELRYEVNQRGSTRTMPRVAAMIAQHDANQAQRQAAEMMQRGQAQQAAAALAQAHTVLESTAAQIRREDATSAQTLSTRAGAIAHDVEQARSADDAEEMRDRAYELQAAPMSAQGY